MSRIPLAHTAAHKVCKAIYEHGQPVTLDEGIALHGYTGLPKRYAAFVLYTKMVKSDYLVEIDGVYALAKPISRYFDGCLRVESKPSIVVPPKYSKQFAPMAIIKRDPRIRSDFSFIPMGGRNG